MKLINRLKIWWRLRDYDRARFTKDFRPEWNCWHMARQRCYVSTTWSYENYGGRGIRMCDAWLNSFEQFLRDMGTRPTPSHTLDRINPNGHYTLDNCRWASRHTQRVNIRPYSNVRKVHDYHLEYDGVTQSYVEWSKDTGISVSKIRSRIHRYGWPVGEALGFEPRTNKPRGGKRTYRLTYQNNTPVK